MIEDFDDFCLWMYVVVDDIWQAIKDRVKHRRQEALCSDGELLSMILIAECRGWDVETEALHHWQAHRDLVSAHPQSEPLQSAAAPLEWGAEVDPSGRA